MPQPQPSTKEMFVKMLKDLNIASKTIAKTIGVKPEDVDAAISGNDEAIVLVAKGFHLQALKIEVNSHVRR